MAASALVDTSVGIDDEYLLGGAFFVAAVAAPFKRSALAPTQAPTNRFIRPTGFCFVSAGLTVGVTIELPGLEEAIWLIGKWFFKYHLPLGQNHVQKASINNNQELRVAG